MSSYLSWTPFYGTVNIPKRFLKCKRCKNEFFVTWNSGYAKTVCFCPVCGQEARPYKKSKKENNNE